MWRLALPWWEFILRGVVVYAFLVLLLRVTGKRQVGQLAPFDLVLLLVLSNAVQNSMNGGDNSVTGGLISATTLIVLNGIVGRLTYKSKSLERIIEGRPEILIHNGKLYAEDHELLTGITQLYEGITLCHMTESPDLDVILRASDNQSLVAVSKKQGGS